MAQAPSAEVDAVADASPSSMSTESVISFTIRIVIEMKRRGLDYPYTYRETQSSTADSSTLQRHKKSCPSKYVFAFLHSEAKEFADSIKIIWDIAQKTQRKMGKAEEEMLLMPIVSTRLNHIFDLRSLCIFADHSGLDFREKILLPESKRCYRIEPLLKYPGHLMLTNTRHAVCMYNIYRLYLASDRIYFQAAEINNISLRVFTYPYTSIQQIYKRRYMLRQTGLEFYMDDGEKLFISFESKTVRDDIHDVLIQQPGLKNLLNMPHLSDMLCRWQSRDVSNFEYLTYLNIAAGRSKNDLTQYPVFPWILSDYTSETLNLKDESVYRDLSKPVGALNRERLNYYKMRYHLMPRVEEVNSVAPPFLYGTHYSTPAHVLFYLVRLAPQYMLCLQNGKFDTADRLFRSVGGTWDSCNQNYTDLKELIPEFFDTELSAETWLCNTKHLDLGITQKQERVNDVQLPRWANGDPQRFVQLNSEALESDYVSLHLHEWIDLIFGCKQQGEAALLADNLFYYLSYEGAVDLESVQDAMERYSLELQIQEFGQAPRQLFALPHPQRSCLHGGDQSARLAASDLLLISPRICSAEVCKLDDQASFFNLESSAILNLLTKGALSKVARKHFVKNILSILHPRQAIQYMRSVASCGTHNPPLKPLRVSRAARKGWRWQPRLGYPKLGTPLRHSSWVWERNCVLSDLHEKEITSCLLSTRDGILLTTSKDSSLKISATTEGGLVQTIRLGMALSCCAISPKEEFVFIGCWDNCVYMYLLQTGRRVDKVVAHYDGISAICVANEYLVTSSWDAIVKVWRYDLRGIVMYPLRTFSDWNEAITCMDASPTGLLVVAGSRNGRIYMINLATLHCYQEFCASPARFGDIASISFAADALSFVCLTIENELIQYTLDGEQLFRIEIPVIGQVRCMKSDGAFAVCGSTIGRLSFWRLARPENSESSLIYEIPHAHESTICSLAVSCSGSLLVSGAIDGSLLMWRLQQKGFLGTYHRASIVKRRSPQKYLYTDGTGCCGPAASSMKSIIQSKCFVSETNHCDEVPNVREND